MNATKKWLRNLLFTVALITLTSGIAYAQESLRLVTENYPPLNHVEDGQLKGPVIDVVREILKKLNLSTEIHVYPWSRGYKMLGTLDNIALFSIARTDERENLFKWVGPIAEKKYAFYGKKGSGIKLTNLNDAKAFSVGVQRDGVSEQFLLSEGFVKLDGAVEPVQNFWKLMKGRFDLWYTSGSTVGELSKLENFSSEEIEILYVTKKTKIYIGFSKSTSGEVIQSWQGAYEELYQDGTIHRIYSKYGLTYLVPSIDTPSLGDLVQ